jgi:hypothetical protein
MGQCSFNSFQSIVHPWSLPKSIVIKVRGRQGAVVDQPILSLDALHLQAKWNPQVQNSPTSLCAASPFQAMMSHLRGCVKSHNCNIPTGLILGHQHILRISWDLWNNATLLSVPAMLDRHPDLHLKMPGQFWYTAVLAAVVRVHSVLSILSSI